MNIDLTRFQVTSVEVLEEPRTPVDAFDSMRRFRIVLKTPYAPSGRIYGSLMVSDEVPAEYARNLVRDAVLQQLEHELDEALFIDGKRVRNPHPIEPGNYGVRAVDRDARTYVDEAGAVHPFADHPDAAYVDSAWERP